MFWLWSELEQYVQPFTNPCSTLACAAVALCITLYQRHLSPRKGFSCAHRVYHGGASCSEFARQVVLRVGVLPAVPQVLRRFNECKQACTTGKLSQRKRQQPEPERKAREST